MNRRVVRVLMGALAFVVPLLCAVSAEAATKSGQAGYRCGMQFEGQEDTTVAGQTRHDDNTFAVQLDVPSSIRPGQVLNLRGTAAIQLSEQARKDYSAYVESIDAYSDTLSVAVTVNGRTAVLRADRWQTGRAKIGNPFVVRGGVTFAPLKVPSNARGTIRIGLPQNNVTKNDVDGKPDTVAFTGRARAYLKVPIQGKNQYVYRLACWLPSKTEGRIAEIQIEGSSGTSSSSGSNSNSSSSSSSSSDDDDNNDDDEDDDNDSSWSSSSSVSNVENPFDASAPAPPQSNAPVATPVAAANATLPPGFTNMGATGGIYLPTSVVLFAGLVLLLAAMGYAGYMHYRLSLLERDDD